MKKILSLICLVLLSIVMWGQSDELDDTHQSFKYQIGTDISPLFRNLFKQDLTANSFLSAPYVFIFKSMKNNRAFRFGIGGNIRKEISDDNSAEKLVQNALQVRFGFEKQKTVSERWQINTGIDLKFSTSKLDDNNNSNVNNSFKRFEISPLLGIQFQLTSHLVLQTEASFNFYYQLYSFESNFDIIFPGPFPTPSARKFNTIGGYISIPNALLLVVEF